MTTTLPKHIQSNPLAAEDLRELMLSVNEVTARLQKTHDDLRREVTGLKAELAEANEQLRRSKSLAAVGEMAAGIAHEIRNPLGSILLYSQMLIEDLEEQPEQLDVCRKISRAVEGLDGIVRDVLAFARDTTIDPKPTPIEALINPALEQCAGLIFQHGASVAQSIATEDDATVIAEPTLMIQAIGNIVRNAIEASAASAAKPAVAVSAIKERRRVADGRRAERIVFRVEDNGPGIPADVVKRMFNPFFTTRRAGTGLGLAIVHRIVDAHGGEVAVGNRTEGGARIELCLPVDSEIQSVRDDAADSLSIHIEEQSLSETVARRITTERYA